MYRVIFTGTVVAVPDVMALTSPGERAECRREGPQRKNAAGGQEGVRGLKALGVRDLSYRIAFVANSVQVILVACNFIVILAIVNRDCTKMIIQHIMAYAVSVIMLSFGRIISFNICKVHFLTFSWQVADDRTDGDIRGRDMDEDDSGRPKFTVSLRNFFNNISDRQKGQI